MGEVYHVLTGLQHDPTVPSIWNLELERKASLQLLAASCSKGYHTEPRPLRRDRTLFQYMGAFQYKGDQKKRRK